MNSNQSSTLRKTPSLPAEPWNSGERSEPEVQGSAGSEPPVASGTLLFGRLPLALSILSRSAPPTPIHRRPHGSRVGFVQMPDQQRTEISHPPPQPQPLQTHRLSHESFPNEPTSPLPLDLPVLTHLTHPPSHRIRHRRQLTRISPPARMIKLRRCALPQSFVGSLLVVIHSPTRHPMLLAPHAPCRRSRRLSLEHSMILLVPPVLFGMPGLDKLHHDPQARPPDAQPRQPCGPRRTKRTPIVHPNPVRQTPPPQQPDNLPTRPPPTLIEQHPHPQPKPTPIVHPNPLRQT